MFLLSLLVVEWPFASFLMTNAAQDRFFATGYHPYAMPPWSASVTRHFVNAGHSEGRLVLSNELYKRHPMRSFPAKDRRADSTPDPASNPASKRRRLPATSGTQTGINSAPGLQWPEHRSKRSRNSPATRRSRCLRAIVIFLRSTGFPSSIRSPRRIESLWWSRDPAEIDSVSVSALAITRQLRLLQHAYHSPSNIRSVVLK